MLGFASAPEAIIVADFEAGIGTLTRLGDTRVDAVLVVTEPTAKSLEVARRAAALAAGLCDGPVVLVANRVTGDDDATRSRDAAPAGVEVVLVPDDAAVRSADRDGQSPLDVAPSSPAVAALAALAQRLAPTAP